MSDPCIIAIDGPAGSGKSTLASALAQRLAIPYLNTGMLYRAIAKVFVEQNVDWQHLDQWLEQLSIGVIVDATKTAFVPVVAGKTIDLQLLKQETIAEQASRLAVEPSVRDKLLVVQRQAVQPEGLIVEGRDTTTVVFPQATLKLFLTASVQERARRRAQELGHDTVTLEMLAAIEQRDFRDRARAQAPLRVASGAVTLDSTKQSIADMVAYVLELLDSKASGLQG